MTIYVEGIVYKIDQDNRRQLDRNEGVGRGYYKAKSFTIHFTPLQDHGCKTGYVAEELETKTVPKQDIDPKRSDKTSYQGNEEVVKFCYSKRTKLSPLSESYSQGNLKERRRGSRTRRSRSCVHQYKVQD